MCQSDSHGNHVKAHRGRQPVSCVDYVKKSVLLQPPGSDKCLGIGSSDTQAEGSMTWMIFLAAFNGTLFQPLNHLPTFQSAEACYNFIALLNYKGDEQTRLICVPR